MDGQKRIPDWLTKPEGYRASARSERYVQTSLLSLAGVLKQFRLDDGTQSSFSPSVPLKLLLGLVFILLVSLSRNYAFVLVALAIVLVRAALLPVASLRRMMAVATGAAVLTFVLMLPALLLGQPHSALLIATKVFVSVGCAMLVALTTPYNELTASLRTFRIPSLIVMTFDLALKNIVRLGRVATEVLTALRLRSVGTTSDKGSAIGGVGGVVLLKSSEAATATFDAMTCRGFDGKYASSRTYSLKGIDVAWIMGFVFLLGVFVYLQGVV